MNFRFFQSSGFRCVDTVVLEAFFLTDEVVDGFVLSRNISRDLTAADFFKNSVAAKANTKLVLCPGVVGLRET